MFPSKHRRYDVFHCQVRLPGLIIKTIPQYMMQRRATVDNVSLESGAIRTHGFFKKGPAKKKNSRECCETNVKPWLGGLEFGVPTIDGWLLTLQKSHSFSWWKQRAFCCWNHPIYLVVKKTPNSVEVDLFHVAHVWFAEGTSGWLVYPTYTYVYIYVYLKLGYRLDYRIVTYVHFQLA